MKKFTIKDFLAGKVSIRCENKNQKKAVLKVCKENGIVWNGGEPIDNHFPDEPVLTVGFWGNGRLTHGYGNHPGTNVVAFDEIDLSPASRYQILIESDGETTTAKMVVNGKEVKQATAKRNPADKPNWHIGANLAFFRLWNAQKKPTKPKVREVKRQAKAGEYIRLTKTTYSFDRVGLILRVDKAEGCAYVLRKNHPTASTNVVPDFLWAYLPHAYVVLEGYQPGRDGKRTESL